MEGNKGALCPSGAIVRIIIGLGRGPCHKRCKIYGCVVPNANILYCVVRCRQFVCSSGAQIDFIDL